MGNKTLVALAMASLLIGGASDDSHSNATDSLASINQCYHGVHGRTPCVSGRWTVSWRIGGRWVAENNSAQTMEFIPNGYLDLSNGIIRMSHRSGFIVSGEYHIRDGTGDYASLFIDMPMSMGYRADVAFYGQELVEVDEGVTTTFRRP